MLVCVLNMAECFSWNVVLQPLTAACPRSAGRRLLHQQHPRLDLMAEVRQLHLLLLQPAAQGAPWNTPC